MKTTAATDPIIAEYLRNTKYYCSKCRFYVNYKCTKKRVIKECREKRLKNV